MNRHKKLFAFLTLVCFLFTLMPIAAFAENAEIVASGECGENVRWTLDSEGVLTISGTGNMDDYRSVAEVPWKEYADLFNELVIEDGVTSIGDNAFRGESNNIERITLSKDLKRIGKYSFAYCLELGEIHFPNTLENIGEYAFYMCDSLRKIYIPENVHSIGYNAFSVCNELNSIEVADGNKTFYTTGVDLIAKSALGDTLLCYAIGNESETYDVPENITTIAPTVFYNGANLKTVSIHENVEKIMNYQFGGCINLESINVHADNQNYNSIDGVLFEEDSLIIYPCKKAGTEYTIPNGIVDIQSEAFRYCENLISVTIPEGVERLNEYTFCECYSLEEVYLPISLKMVAWNVFANCFNLTDVYYNGSTINWNTIEIIETGNDALLTAEIHYAMSDKPVSPEKSYVEIPKEAYILDGKYEGVPFEVHFCDEDGNLTAAQGNIYFWMADNNPAMYGWSKHGVGKNDSLYNNELNTVVYYGIKEADNNSEIYISFYEPGEYEICYSFTKPIVENGTTIVSAPDGTANVKVIDNPNCGDSATWTLSEDGVLTISGSGKVSYGPWEYYLSDITKIIVEEGITELGVVFHSTDNLKVIDLPASLEKVGEGTLWLCDGLEAINIAQGNKALYVANDTLYQKTVSDTVLITHWGKDDAEDIIIPDGVTRIAEHAFDDNDIIQSITLPRTIETLGNHCFGLCDELKQIYIPNSVQELGYYMFEGSDKLTDIYYGGTEEQWNTLNGDGKVNTDGITIHFNSTGIPSDSTTDNNTSSGTTGSGGGSYTPSTNQNTDDVTINNTNSNLSIETSDVKASVIKSANQMASKDSNLSVIGGADCAVNITAEDKQGNDVNGFFTPLTVEIPVDSAALKSVDNLSHLTLAKVVTDENGNTSLVYMGGNYDTQTGLFTAYVDEPGDYVLVEDADVKKIELQIGNKSTDVNGKTITSDVAPRIIDGHTYVPLRYIAEILGCEVAWDEATRTVTITQNGITMKLVIDEEIEGYGVAAVIRENRTLVPLRYIAEMLGANVIWHPETQEIAVVK